MYLYHCYSINYDDSDCMKIEVSLARFIAMCRPAWSALPLVMYINNNIIIRDND